MKKAKIIILVCVILVIIAGGVLFRFKGANLDLIYSTHTTVILKAEEVNKDELASIGKEIFNNRKFFIQESEANLAIIVKEFTQEDKTKLVKAVNEKYTLELTEDSLKINENPSIKLWDLMKKYVKAITIATIIITIYFAVMFRKKDIMRIMLTTILSILIVQLFVISLFILVRIPLNRLFIPILLTIFTANALTLSNKFKKM